MAPPRKQIKKERLKTNIQEIPEEEYIEELPELNLAPVDTTPNEFDNDYTLLLKIAVENDRGEVEQRIIPCGNTDLSKFKRVVISYAWKYIGQAVAGMNIATRTPDLLYDTRK